MFGLLHPTKHTLLGSGSGATELNETVSDFAYIVHPVPIDDHAVAARFGLNGTGLVLIRPDGYVGFLSSDSDPAALCRHLGQMFTEEKGAAK